MRRLGVRGADALELQCLHGVGHALLVFLQSVQHPFLLNHHAVEHLVLALDVGESGFEFLDAFQQCVVHADKLPKVVPASSNFGGL
mgnify:CR=1 FL=1